MTLVRIRQPALPRSFFLPYPELVESAPHEGPWFVADSNEQNWLPTNGATDKLGKRIYVPLEPGGEGVSLHEMAHVRWSPDRFPEVDYPLICLQAVEDARINLGLAAVGLPFSLDREQLAEISHLAARDTKARDFSFTILRAVASLGTEAASLLLGEVDTLPAWAASIGRTWLFEVEHRLAEARGLGGGPVAPFDVAHEIATALAADLEAHGLLDRSKPPRALGCCHVLGVAEGGAIGADGKARRLSLYEHRILLAQQERGGAELAAGRMRISRPPLTLRQPLVNRGGVSRGRCRTEGTRITRPDRLALDGAIFGRPGRTGGGTVLVDASGSMAVDEDEVESIVRAAGGSAVVAMYSGREDIGELRILADGDRRVTPDQLEPFGGGNIVDLPALQWLAKQPGPRLWISDGCVTGVGDAGCGRLLARCRAVATRARIRRVETTKAALEVLGQAG